MNWQNYPLIRLIIPFTLGMIGANLFIVHMNIVVLFVLCCIALACSFFFIKTSETHKDEKFGVVAMTLFFLIGMTLYTDKHHRIASSIPQDTTFCRGILTELPQEKAHSWALHLQQDDAHIILYVGKGTSHMVSALHRGEGVGEKELPLSLGDTILASITHFNPTSTCPDDTFKTYYAYLFNNGICATAYAPSNRWAVKPCNSKPSLLMSFKNLQEKLHTLYDERGLKGEAGSIVEAMTIGRKVNLSSKIRTTYAHAGVSHVLALSGFHVGIIFLLIQVFFFKPMLPLRWQWVSNIFIILALWLYALITGMSPSLVRATTMFTILLLCQSLSRDVLSPNSCALAFFIMLCINPFYLYDIGFQLSFTSVVGISLFSEAPITATPKHPFTSFSIYRFFGTIIRITLICTLFTAPLVAHYFGCIPFLSILSNLVLTFFVHLLMWTSILWWLFLWCDPVNALLTDLLNWTATTMSSITDSIASVSFATIEWHPDTLETLLCYVLLLGCTYLFTRRKSSSLRLRHLHSVIR